jgi:Gpi18-like mannosyltransferase
LKWDKGFPNLTPNRLIILGLLIRLVPASFTAHPTDMQAWKTIGSAIYNGQNPYTLPAYGLVYPPLWGFICSVAYAVYTQTQNSFVFNFAIKLPIILVDIAMARTIETIVLTKTQNQNTAREAMILYLFNPLTIILSSFWGMFDAIPAFLILLSMIFLNKRQYLKSSLALGVGIAFKGAYPALLLPLFLYVIIKTEGRGKTLVYLASSLLVPVVASMPFVVADANSFVNLTMIHNLQGQLSNLTYWLAIRFVFSQNLKIISTISLATFIIAFLTVYTYVLRKTDPKMIIRSVILVVLAFYLTSPTVNEQYFVWWLPPMVIYVTTEMQDMKTYLHTLTVIVTLYAISNTGLAFFMPINSQLGQYQHLFGAMVICSLIFPVVSAVAFRKTMAENDRKEVLAKMSSL